MMSEGEVSLGEAPQSLGTVLSWKAGHDVPPSLPSHEPLPCSFAFSPGSPTRADCKGHAHPSPNPRSLTPCLLSSAPRALLLSVLSVLVLVGAHDSGTDILHLLPSYGVDPPSSMMELTA